MKSFIINLLLILSTTQLFSQQLTEAITGSWKVVDSKINLKLAPDVKQNMDTTQQKKLDEMRVAFIGAVFTFKANNEFLIAFTDKSPEFIKELGFLNHQKWKSVSGGVVAIGSAEDNYSLMKIFTGSKEGKNYFILDESPFVLEVILVE